MATKSMEKSGKSAAKNRRKSAQAKAKTTRTRKTKTEPKTKKSAVSRSSPKSTSSTKKKTLTPQSSGINSISELKKQQSEKNRHTAEKSFIATRSRPETALASAKRKPTARGYNKYFKLVSDPSVKTMAEETTSATTYAKQPSVQLDEEKQNQQNLKFAPLSAAKQEPVIPAPKKIRKKMEDRQPETEKETFVTSDSQSEKRSAGEEQEIIKRILGEKTSDHPPHERNDKEDQHKESTPVGDGSEARATRITVQDEAEEHAETETADKTEPEVAEHSATVSPEDTAGLTASELEASLLKEARENTPSEKTEDTEDSDKDDSAVSTIAKWLLKLVKPSEVKTEPAKIIRADDDPDIKTESSPEVESGPPEESETEPETRLEGKQPESDQAEPNDKAGKSASKEEKSTDKPVLIRQSKTIQHEHNEEVKSWQPSRIEVTETTDYHGLDQDTYDNLTNARTGKPAVEKKVVASKLLDSGKQAGMEKNRIKSFNPEKVESSEGQKSAARSELKQPVASEIKAEKKAVHEHSEKVEGAIENKASNKESREESVFVSSQPSRPARETLGEGDLDEDDFNTDIQRIRVKRKIPDLIARLYRDFDRERVQAREVKEETVVESKPVSRAKSTDTKTRPPDTKKDTQTQSRTEKPRTHPSKPSTRRGNKDAIPDVISRFYKEMLPEGAQLTETPEDEPWGPSEPKAPMKAFDDEPRKPAMKNKKPAKPESDSAGKATAEKKAQEPHSDDSAAELPKETPKADEQSGTAKVSEPTDEVQKVRTGSEKSVKKETALKQRIIASSPTFKLDKSAPAETENDSIDKLEEILAEERNDEQNHPDKRETQQVKPQAVEDTERIQTGADIPEDAVDLVMMTAEQEVVEDEPENTPAGAEPADLQYEDDEEDDDEIEELLARAQKETELEQNSGMEIEQIAELEKLSNNTERSEKPGNELNENGPDPEHFSADGMVDYLNDDMVLPVDEESEKMPDTDSEYYEVKSNKPSKPWSLDVEIALRDLVGNIDTLDESSLDGVIYDWKKAYNEYFDQVVSTSRYPYIWLDSCLDKSHPGGKIKHYLAVIGANATGQRKLLALTEGDPASADDWKKTLTDLEQRGLANPRLFVGAPELSAWSELAKIFPRADKQYCWNSVKCRILRRISASKKNAASKLLELINQAHTKNEALELIDRFRGIYGRENSVAVGNLLKYKDGLLRYFDFPQKHWNDITVSRHLSTVFPSGELLATIYKYDRFYEESLYPIFIHLNRTQSKWPRLKAMGKIRQLLDGKKFVDGKPASAKKVAPVSRKTKSRKSKSILDSISEKATNLISKLAQSETGDNPPKTEKTREKRKLILKSPEKLLGQDKQDQELEPETRQPVASASTDQVSSEDMARFLLDLHKKRSEGAVQPRLRLDKLAKLAEENKKKKAVSGLEKEFLKELNKRKMSAKQ